MAAGSFGGLSFLRTLLITPFMTRTANGRFPPECDVHRRDL
jgi:hypothetical protein